VKNEGGYAGNPQKWGQSHGRSGGGVVPVVPLQYEGRGTPLETKKKRKLGHSEGGRGGRTRMIKNTTQTPPKSNTHFGTD